jgi:hypothetical protein
MSNGVPNNRSALRDFLGSVATVSGDLSNITAPPFVLAENSTVEIPQYWADHPSLFATQGSQNTAEERSLSVLKYFIGTLRNQQYAGRQEKDGVKKPLNAFLGELFLGRWSDKTHGETRLIAEQVSHHPPVTACYLSNEKHGVRAQGFTQQEITFSGNVNIKQKGYVLLHLDKVEEDYLIPVPDVKVKGLLGGTPYPELQGNYSLISSSGYISRLTFAGKNMFGSGQKNRLEAKLYHTDRPDETLYTVTGAWNGKLTFHDTRSGEEIDTFDANNLTSENVEVADLVDQDPWESRKAWGEVISSLHRGDMRRVVNAKARIEEGQRHMREAEQARGEPWQAVFFRKVDRDPVFEKLSALDPGSFKVDTTGGFWKANWDAIKNAKKPYHGDLLPTNETVGNSFRDWTTNRDSIQVDTRERNGTAGLLVPESTSGSNVTTRSGTPRSSIDVGSIRGKRNSEERRAPDTPNAVYKEPTDAQVEAFLRAKNSTSK